MRTPLQKGEKVLLVTYSNWLTLVLPALIALGCVVGAFFIPNWHWGLVLASIGIVIFLYRYFEWKVNIWVVTNYRVIDENGLISHYAKESPLDKINNVSYDQNVWGRIFRYGHVEIQTAAEVGATDYYNVYHPKRLKDTIMQAQSEYKHLQTDSQAAQMAAAFNQHAKPTQHSISDELEKLYNLKQKGILSEEEYLKAKNRLIG